MTTATLNKLALDAHSTQSHRPHLPLVDAMDVRFLWFRECREFARYGIMAPPRAAVPPGYKINIDGVPVPPVPPREDLVQVIEARRRRLPEHERAMPRYAPDSA